MIDKRHSILICFFAAAQLHAATVTHYRFEVDNDPGIGLSSPNEILGEPALTATSAKIDATANPGSLPNTFVPFNGLPNGASLDGTGPDASGHPDIDARADYTPTLDLNELTIELFARTEESSGVIVSRSSASNVLSTISDGFGFRIYDPQALKVDFYTSDGSNNSFLHQIVTSPNAGLDDISPANTVAAW